MSPMLYPKAALAEIVKITATIKKSNKDFLGILFNNKFTF